MLKMMKLNFTVWGLTLIRLLRVVVRHAGEHGGPPRGSLRTGRGAVVDFRLVVYFVSRCLLLLKYD